MSEQKQRVLGGVRSQPHVRKFSRKAGLTGLGIAIGATAVVFMFDPMEWFKGVKVSAPIHERIEPPPPKMDLEGLPTDYAGGGNAASLHVASVSAPPGPPDLSGLPKPPDGAPKGFPPAETGMMQGGGTAGARRTPAKTVRHGLGFEGDDPLDSLAGNQQPQQGGNQMAQMVSMTQGQGGMQGDMSEGGSQADKFRARNAGGSNMFLGNNPISAQAKPGWGIITPGTIIPAKLATATSSELGGNVVARVSSDVYDKATGQCLMLDRRNSEIFGKLSDKVDYGQSMQQAVWKSIHTPAMHLDIGGMDATDASGRTGIDSQTNRHYGRLATAAIAATALDVIGSWGRSAKNSGTEINIGGAAANNVASIGQQIVQRELQVKDELQQIIGAPVSLMVDKIIELPCLNRR